MNIKENNKSNDENTSCADFNKYREIFFNKEITEVIFMDQLCLWFTEYQDKNYTLSLIDVNEDELCETYIIMEHTSESQERVLPTSPLSNRLGIKDFYAQAEGRIIEVVLNYSNDKKKPELSYSKTYAQATELSKEQLPLSNVFL